MLGTVDYIVLHSLLFCRGQMALDQSKDLQQVSAPCYPPSRPLTPPFLPLGWNPRLILSNSKAHVECSRANILSFALKFWKKKSHEPFDFSEGEYIINIMVVEYTIDIFRGSPHIAAFQFPNISTALDKQMW